MPGVILKDISCIIVVGWDRTRYCNKTCQHDHWRRGHKQMCKKIHRGGNAEQYNADKKYKEAVALAVAK